MSTTAALGAAIRRRREDRGMSPSVLAALSGLGPVALAAIENGDIPPSDWELAAIAAPLRSEPDALRRSAAWLARQQQEATA